MTFQFSSKCLMLFSRGLQLVSRTCISTVLNLFEVYFPLADIELVGSAYMFTGLSWARHLVQMRSGWRFKSISR